MKVAITTEHNTLNTLIDFKFGRCKYFLIIDIETMDFKTIENSSKLSAHGAGISAAQTIIDEEIDALITGHIGPNAFNVLKQSNIKIYTTESKNLLNTIDDFKNNKLKEIIVNNIG